MAWARRAALFLLAAWPAWIVSVPPLQDLPNHLATAYVQLHSAQYPELVSNGFLKTNSTLFLFLHLAARVVSLRTAAKLFVTLVALVGAIGYPSAARVFGRNENAAVLLLWPLVHNWFVAMGMLDYALSVPLGLLALVAIARERWALATVLCIALWYTHAFTVLVLAMLVALEIGVRGREHWRMGLPLLPALALTAWSALAQVSSEAHVETIDHVFAGAPDLLYGAWAECLWSLTKWTLASLACVPVLLWYGVRRFRSDVPFFSPVAMLCLVGLYFALPYHAHLWFFIPARMLPFIWMGFALRVPSDLPKWLMGGLAACALLFSAGLGVEYSLIARDWDAVTRGEEAVPRGARLLPFVFDRKGPHGDNTWPMLHIWGLYVVDRGTTAPLVFAHSRSFPISYARQPPDRWHGLYLEQFPETMRTVSSYCKHLHEGGIVPDDCAASYKETWSEVWRDAATRFDRVLLVGPSPSVVAALSPLFRVVYFEGETVVLAPRL